MPEPRQLMPRAAVAVGRRRERDRRVFWSVEICMMMIDF